MRWPGFKRKALTLSYDDGVVFDKKLIDIMTSHGLKGTFNINSGLFPAETGGRRMTKDEAYELYTKSGMEVAVHGVKHLSLDAVCDAVAVNDIVNDRVALENMFGTLVEGMAYAYGAYNEDVVELLKKCGIKYARTVDQTGKFEIPEDFLRWHPTAHHKNRGLTELAKDFVENEGGPSAYSKRPLLFYLWGHSYEFNDSDNWHIMEEFAEYMGGREDIWYATNGDIYNYVTAFDSLRYSADGTLVYNPTATDVYVSYRNGDFIIPAGKIVDVATK